MPVQLQDKAVTGSKEPTVSDLTVDELNNLIKASEEAGKTHTSKAINESISGVHPKMDNIDARQQKAVTTQKELLSNLHDILADLKLIKSALNI